MNKDKAVTAEPAATVVSAYGDPESFGERRLALNADIQKMPYGTNFYTAPIPCPKCTEWQERYECNTAIMHARTKKMNEYSAKCAELETKLERERIRLSACGVVALSNTPDSAVKAREMLPEYRSASCDDVARIVDSEMLHRAKCAELEATIAQQAERIKELEQEDSEVQCLKDAMINKQAEQLAAAERDSARYRFIRDNPWNGTPLGRVISQHRNSYWDESIDRAIAAHREVK